MPKPIRIIKKVTVLTGANINKNMNINEDYFR